MFAGHPSNRAVGIPVAMSGPTPGGIPIGGPVNRTPTMPGSTVIDGTPTRVVVYALAAAAGLLALRMAGFKFNVGVSA